MTIDRSARDADYRIFLLTFWLEDDDGRDPETWRFRLEDPKSGARLGCVGVGKLIDLLVDEIADPLVPVPTSKLVQNSNHSDSG